MSDKQIWALIVDGRVRQLSATDPAGLYPPDWCWQPIPLVLSSVVDATWSWSSAGFVPPDLDALRRRQLSAALRAVDAAEVAALADVPAVEQKTWPAQAAESRAVLADAGTPSPLLTVMIAERGLGETVCELAEKVRAAEARYIALAGRLTGWYQRVSREINAAADALAVMSVDVALPS